MVIKGHDFLKSALIFKGYLLKANDFYNYIGFKRNNFPSKGGQFSKDIIFQRSYIFKHYLKRISLEN